MDKNCEPIARLIGCFMSLPGVGYKTAQRYAYSVLKLDKTDCSNFAKAIVDVKDKVKFCKICGNFTENDVCDICKNRQSDIICVVKEPKDIIALEKVKNTKWVYHVLQGCISPLEGKGPDDIRIKELLDRINNSNIKEIILATNPDVEGEATAIYISRLLKPLGIKTTRLAQGISMGSDLEYADEVTLTKAIESRTEI